MLQAVALLAERNDVEVSVGSRHVCFDATLHERFLLQAIGDEVADADNLESMFASHLLELWHACHRAVLVQDFYQGSSRLQAREAGKIDGSFRVSSAAKNAFVLCVEGIDVARATEVSRLAIGVGKCTDGSSAVVCADTRRAAFQEVHCHGERRAKHACIVFHLMVQFEFSSTAHRDGCTKHASAVAQHEVDLFGSNHLGSRDEVALVLAVLIIHDDDKLPLSEVVERRLDGAKF